MDTCVVYTFWLWSAKHINSILLVRILLQDHLSLQGRLKGVIFFQVDKQHPQLQLEFY